MNGKRSLFYLGSSPLEPSKRWKLPKPKENRIHSAIHLFNSLNIFAPLPPFRTTFLFLMKGISCLLQFFRFFA